MKRENLPSIDMRYWLAMVVASIVGTTSGDFVSSGLGLGFLDGLLPLAVLLTLVLLAERRLTVTTQAFYWVAIVITRTAATNIGDLFTHQLKLEYAGMGAVLGALLVIALLFRWHAVRPALSQQSANSHLKTLPSTDATYWLCVLIASTLGTTMGDFVSAGMQFGTAWGSLILGALLVVVLLAQSKIKVAPEVFYWVAIVMVRTAGTDMGDFLSGSDGLNLGVGLAAAVSGVALIGVLTLWPKHLFAGRSDSVCHH